MKLLNFTVGGFKNIAKTTINLGGITAFVSPNNYGKSNLFTALSFATEFLNVSPRARTQMMGYIGGVPLIPELEDEDFQFQIEFEDSSLGEYRFVRYGFSFAWPKNDGSGQVITDETIELKSAKNARWTRYLKREDGEYKKSYSTRSFRKIQLDSNQLAIDILTAIEDIEINPAIKCIKRLGFLLCGDIDPSDRFMQSPFEIISNTANSGLAFNDYDVPRAMYQLKMKQRNRFDDLMAALYTLFPEFEVISVDQLILNNESRITLENQISELQNDENTAEVPFRIRNDIYSITIRSANLNQPVDMNMMSTGTKRLAWLLTNIIIAENVDAKCLGIEEIETSIHPKMISELLELIDENLGSTPLLITSHSPYLVQYLNPRQLYIGVPTDTGVAKFKKLRTNMIDKLSEYAYDRGLSTGEYLFELMSSDGSDTLTLKKFLEV